MISGLTFDYAHARVAARLAQRPDERLWTQLRSSRSVPALLEAVRVSSAASTVSGVPPAGDADAIELSFRQQLRTRIVEVAGWSPSPWRPSLLYTRHLVDLPALLHLLADEPPPRWIAADPVLSTYALPTLAQRRGALAEGPLGPLIAAAERSTDARRPLEPIARALRRLRAGGTLHRLLAAWEAEWRRLWPPVDAEQRMAIDGVVELVRSHLLRFPSVPVDEATNVRQSLGARLATAVRRSASQPAALFAYLALFAVDLERLRGEFVLRARPVGGHA
ncbi:MAG TPA: hypothetical protein VFN64_14335 [Burkholderiaceae bacterium]|nr:hypothetical protein [Burkholderiaceae bacterium]